MLVDCRAGFGWWVGGSKTCTKGLLSAVQKTISKLITLLHLKRAGQIRSKAKKVYFEKKN
jgi:hypothetical protein